MVRSDEAIVIAYGDGSAALRIIGTLDEWDNIEGEWRSLFDRSPTASFALRWEWMREWWRIYGPVYGHQAKSLRVFTFWRGDRLIGACPLYLGYKGVKPMGLRRLGFLGTGEASFEETCAEYLDLLYLPHEEKTCLQALAQILSGPSDWEEAEFAAISGQSPLAAIPGLLSGPDVKADLSPSMTCSIANLTGGMEAYLMRLSSNSRGQSRRLLRSVENDRMVFEIASTADEAQRFFDQLLDLHQRRWVSSGESGCFAAPRFTEFHRRLASSLTPAGEAILARLSIGGHPIAMVYGFVTRTKFDFYQSGVMSDWKGNLSSPGIAAHLLLMQRLSDRGISHYDFLAGEHTYKDRLSTEKHDLCLLRVKKRSIRASLYRYPSLVKTGLRKAASELPLGK
jgi:hypothetical protein